ncbi:autotransporter domain-containing protein [Bosea sp. TAF32]|uniref:autotransporter domain-containing protein n=1 Tax=Bosea sp. TAF32 TaxID=3237482 RepID=UPI003F90A9DC
MVAASPTLAGGGAGGTGGAGPGGTGGVNSAIGNGTAGSGSSVAGTGTVNGGGGAGGGAGITGGAGGRGAASALGTGGVGGASPGADGTNGSNGSTQGAGGGGGGAHGAVGAALPVIDAKGGNGGNGGASTGGGGGGGAGGYGAVVTGAGVTGTYSVNITGGNGGAGGNGGGVSQKGSGGSGGIGLLFTSGVGDLTFNGDVKGGNGGGMGNGPGGAAGEGGTGIALGTAGVVTINGSVAGGTGGGAGTGAGGVAGAGGVGITATSAQLVVSSSGSVAGGVGGDGTQANAITFTSGANSLELHGGATIGGVVQGGSGTDTLILGGSTNATFDASQFGGSGQFRSFEAFSKAGTSTWTLTNSTTGTTPWVVTGGALAISTDGALGAVAGGLTLSGGALATTADITTARGITLGVGGGTFSPDAGTTLTLNGNISGSGSLTANGAGKVTLTGMNSYTGATTITPGTTLALSGQGRVNASSGVEVNGTFDVTAAASAQIKALTGAATGTVQLGAAGLIVNNASGTFAGALHGSGGLQITGGTQVLSGASDFTGGAGISAGATLRIGNGGTTGSITSDVTNYGTLVFDRSNEMTYAGVVTGPNTGAISITGGGKIILTGTSSSRAPVTIDAGSTLQLGTGGTSGWLGGTGAYVGSINNNGSLVYNRSNNVSYAGVISGGGSVEQVGPGTLTLSGTHTYTGATSITGGTLVVNGSIASSSGLTIGAAGRLSGSGQVPGVVITGTLAPGNSPGRMTVNGNLTLTAGSVYEAEIQGAVSDRVNVTGTAALAGTLKIIPLGGAYSFNSPYTLLSAAAGRTGTFSPVNTTGSFGDGVTTTVNYTATDVQLTLAPKPLVPIVENPTAPAPTSPRLGVVAPANAFAIASVIDRAVAAGGDPSSLFGIYNLPAAAIPAAVNQLSGEIHTAAPALANVAADQFLRAMLDPMAAGRLGLAAPGPGAAAFSGLVRKGADEPAAPARLDAPIYSVWGSAFGSYGRTDGDAAIGSARRTIDDAHIATGIDVRLMPGTVAGLAIAGGKARASLPGLVGKIDADVFQAGVYGVTQLGPVKLGAAASYARLDNDVSRGIPALGSSLSSSYETTAWSGRLQASVAAFSWSGFSLSPLAAIQATQARNPAVLEANWSGASAGALAVGKRNEVTSRSELGLQLDADGVFGGMPVTGYVRAAWAHYLQRDADLTASFVGLPGLAFAATGAKVDRNSALVAAGISAKLSERVSLGLNLDGELASSGSRLGGSAQIRVSF